MMKNTLLLATSLLIVSCLSVPVTQPACINKDGQAVDWWVAYAFPKTFRDLNPNVGYQYADSSSTDPQFVIMKGVIDYEGEALSRTVSQINEQNLKKLVWNDAKLNTDYDFIPAHSKFFMAANDELTHGFAIAHSFPKYPEIAADGNITVKINYQQKRLGQHAFCFTLDSSAEIQQIISHAGFIQPNIHINTIGSVSLDSQANQSDFKDESMTLGHDRLRIFWQNGWSKTKQKDIFKEIAVNLNANIFTHTWASAKDPPFASECGFKSPRTGKILNVDNAGDLIYQDHRLNLGAQPSWTQRNDHSKWIVSNDGNYVCLGDLNRNTVHQQVRGGAYYCLKNSRLAKMFKQLIASTHWGTCYWNQDQSPFENITHTKPEESNKNIGCLNPSGQVVDWWIVYQIPGAKTIPRFYYYDITHGDKGKLTLINQAVDADGQPLRRTLHQLNSHNLNTLIWNGQIENNQKPSDNPELEEAELDVAPCSVKSETEGYNRAFGTQAHSKFFMGVNQAKDTGFGVVHSFPHFPKFITEDDKIDEQVGESQKFFGQHAFCFTLRGAQSVKKFVDNTCNVNPEIYYDTMPVTLDTDTEKAQYRKHFRADQVTQCTLSNKPNYFERCEIEDISSQPFEEKKFSLGADELAVYYKNGFMQNQPADMFQHIVEQFESDILLQTWGRPRPYADATFQVNGQSYELKTKGRLECKECLTSKGSKTWCGGSDHSKWLITDSASKHVSCFGDLNRNTQAQLKRGGAFYCLDHKGLHEALKSIITDTPCETQEEAEPQQEN